ncbi:nitric oxide synthase oxygenase [Kibdelosporangium phytohabitans]|uniref:nitric oxide synthase oxygenase n=1 Tax=Kibdelosporangium phytohabitans TaxID=860235 RepID=UPI000A42FA22|nr:nitric oxide synthase oxygenase [Kibdelosporangium phytohabitans]MBE1463986.1 nitric-oxide synthase [Kibdelosporangium phytohabitans]
MDPAAAAEFLQQFHAENPSAGDVDRRVAWVMAEIDLTGTYQHTTAELAYGAQLAWRNSARCIGRLYWRSLRVRDLRAIRAADDIAEHCVRHLRQAWNGGKIRPMISVFAPQAPGRPAPRIWNEQLIRYAAYPKKDGGVLGDPRYLGFTDSVVKLGWRPAEPRGAFDVLPLVIETTEAGVQLYELPADALQEVAITHPDLPWLAELGLRWHAVPVISSMRLVIGGVSYPAAPFNGWYMGTEIGARNLADIERYDLLPEVARRLELDTSSETTLWRDRAMVELNRAVLHSYAAADVTITDHHTESGRFIKHLEKEQRAGRTCPADWSWIVPPMTGSQTPVFHRYYDIEQLRPEFVLDDDAARRGTHGVSMAPLPASPLPETPRPIWHYLYDNTTRST